MSFGYLDRLSQLYALDWWWTPPTFSQRLVELIREHADDGEGGEEMANALRAEADAMCPPESSRLSDGALSDTATFDLWTLYETRHDVAAAKRCLLSAHRSPSEALIYIERVESTLDNAEIELGAC